MNTARFFYWQDEDKWLGCFEEYPDNMTQGESLEDLRENLKDLFLDLTSGEIHGRTAT
jgi:predicted RNase H-like HicB family nuclease